MSQSLEDRRIRRAADPSRSGRSAAPVARADAWERPTPPPSARNYVLLILDSCRYDTFVEAAPRHMSRLGPVRRRYSYATWTAPAHYNLLMGLLPHSSPPNVFASEHYKQDFRRFGERLGVPDINFAGMLPRLWLPDYLRNTVGYHTRALVSMPVLNPHTPLAAHFDSWILADRPNDLRALLERMEWSEERPTFWLLNTGETHYPYATPDEPESEWPRIHGVNGIFKQVQDELVAGRPISADRFFDPDQLERLRVRQVDAVRYLDEVVEALFDTVPPGTWITITSDHGELFGEGGYFGHGPINHEKVLEVPFVEGIVR